MGRNKRITAKSESSGLRGSLQSGAERGDNFQEQRGASEAACWGSYVALHGLLPVVSICFTQIGQSGVGRLTKAKGKCRALFSKRAGDDSACRRQWWCIFTACKSPTASVRGQRRLAETPSKSAFLKWWVAAHFWVVELFWLSSFSFVLWKRFYVGHSREMAFFAFSGKSHLSHQSCLTRW